MKEMIKWIIKCIIAFFIFLICAIFVFVQCTKTVAEDIENAVSEGLSVSLQEEDLKPQKVSQNTPSAATSTSKEQTARRKSIKTPALASTSDEQTDTDEAPVNSYGKIYTSKMQKMSIDEFNKNLENPYTVQEMKDKWIILEGKVKIITAANKRFSVVIHRESLLKNPLFAAFKESANSEMEAAMLNEMFPAEECEEKIVNLSFNTKYKSELAKIKKGQTITICGKINKNANALSSCRLLKIE